jgi:hypothetical protein
MSRVLIAGVALATAVMTGPSADAGHRRSCCCPTYSTASQGGWYHSRSGSGYYVPMASRSSEAVPAPSGPPTATRSGQTIRRFSEEPNTPAAPVASGMTYAAGPSYSSQFTAPTVGTYIPPNSSSSPARNPVDRRLHPGGGWMRN